jgi:4-hydroxy 2-oxovalerate aldolase
MHEDKGLSDLSIVSGMSGVFSAFKTQVQRASKKFNVNGRDIFRELGNRKVVAGQDDMVIEVAKMLADKNREDAMSYEIASLL